MSACVRACVLAYGLVASTSVSVHGEHRQIHEMLEINRSGLQDRNKALTYLHVRTQIRIQAVAHTRTYYQRHG